MRKIYSIILFTLCALYFKAATFTVSISGTSYTPSSLTVSVGDVVTIAASSSHPLVEVDQTTWNASGNTPSGSGFGTKTSAYTFTVTSAGTIYYVCQFHASMGMKGQIIVNSATNVTEQAFNSANLLLFPNPATDRFTVKFSTIEKIKLTAKLYSVCGQNMGELFTKEFNPGQNAVRIELEQPVAPGVYFVEFMSDKQKFVKRIVIE